MRLRKKGYNLRNLSLFFVIVLSLFFIALIAAPLIELKFNNAVDGVFYNRTEINDSHGIRLGSPILFMDFNKQEETFGSTYATYVQDNSLNDNYGELGFSGDLITNGDMELDSDWTDTGPPSENSRSSTYAHGGTYSRKLVVSSGWKGLQQQVTVVAGETYRISGWAMTTSCPGSPCGFLGVRTVDGDTPLATLTVNTEDTAFLIQDI